MSSHKQKNITQEIIDLNKGNRFKKKISYMWKQTKVQVGKRSDKNSAKFRGNKRGGIRNKSTLWYRKT
jgi:hypothetical protein